MTKLLVVALVASLLGITAAKHWVLIVAGANTYSNYFSQSTACHSYHTVLSHGVPAENIIQLSFDDVATDKRNPFQNNLVVVPDGKNMYEGCKIDYRRGEVTAELFLKVLQGDKEGVKKLIGRDGPVIDSGPDDNIFVTMVDHGSPGVFYFPNFTMLHSADLNKALKSMHTNKRYNKMVVYIESCESGSMFDGLLPDNINIYGSTCANPHESGYMCCYDSKRKVYVGTMWGNAWEFDTDKADVKTRTLLQQYGAMKEGVKGKSHPQQYGDLKINQEVLGQYQGNVQDGSQCQKFEEKPEKLEFAGIDLINPPINMVDIATVARQLVEPEGLSQEEIAKLKSELFAMLEKKRIAGEFVRTIASLVLGTRDVDEVLSGKQPIKNSVCYKEALSTMNARCPGLHFGKFTYIRNHLQTIVNLCNIKPRAEVVRGILAATATQDMC